MKSKGDKCVCASDLLNLSWNLRFRHNSVFLQVKGTITPILSSFTLWMTSTDFENSNIILNYLQDSLPYFEELQNQVTLW